MVGDFSSAATHDAPEAAKTGSYDILRRSGFADLRVRQPHSVGGATCCHEPDLSNEQSTLDERLDIVFARAGKRGFGGQSTVEVFGDQPQDRFMVAPDVFLWPSDHAGVLARIRFASPPLHPALVPLSRFRTGIRNTDEGHAASCRLDSPVTMHPWGSSMGVSYRLTRKEPAGPTRSRSARAASWLPGTAALIVLTACGGDGIGGPQVLATAFLTPGTATVFTLPPDNSVLLQVIARDQDGKDIVRGVSTQFASSEPTVAAVNASGLVTAGVAGTAVITATVTSGGSTMTAQATIQTVVAPATASVQAPETVFQPAVVNISAGGRVDWTFSAVSHTVTFTTAGAPPKVDAVSGTTVSRTFPLNGTYQYICEIHAGMTGTVRVH